MRRLRVLVAVTVAMSLAVPALAHAGSARGRTLRATYQGTSEFAIGAGGLGMGCTRDTCLTFLARRGEHRAHVTIRDAYSSAVPFDVWDTTPGEVDRTATRSGCGRLSLRISPGHVYEVVPQSGVRGDGCTGVATHGVITANLHR